jgi:hypothetical protein
MFCLFSVKGWQNGRSLLFWLKYFASVVKPTAEDPVMLLVDQHSSRFNVPVMEYCRDHHIRLFVLPPNLTHLLSVICRASYAFPVFLLVLCACSSLVCGARWPLTCTLRVVSVAS